MTPNPTTAPEYATYLRVRDAVRYLISVRGQGEGLFSPSQYWQEELDNFDYMMDASPRLIQKLRHHCYHVTGLKPYDYQKINRNRMRTFTARFQQLLTIADPALLVPESPILGGFGYEVDGEFYNLDTLKYCEVLAGLDRGRILDRLFPGMSTRRLVWEIGGGWGGLAYQFKTLFPDTTYVITDFPELFLFSAVYLQTAFPDAQVRIAGEGPLEESLSGWQDQDFIFLPNFRPELIDSVNPDLLLNTVSFQEMTTAQVSDYVDRAAKTGCEVVYSYNRDQSLYNSELTSVREILSRHYRIVELPLLGSDHRAAGKGSPATATAPLFLKSLKHTGYRHVIGHLLPNRKRGPRAVQPERKEESLSHQSPSDSGSPQHPRVGIGMTVYNGGPFIAEAVGSILNQTLQDFVLVILDDGSTDEETEQVLSRVTKMDPRVHFYRNNKRTGMIAAWRRAFKLTDRNAHKPEYFAWASDHDVWHRRWLEAMVEELDRNRKLALVYPLPQFIDDRGELLYGRVPLFSNQGISNVEARFQHTCERLRGSGNMVYGVFRRRILKKAGVFREVLLPDRLLMIELSLHGRSRQIFSSYWYRRRLGISTLERQSETLFAPGAQPPVARWSWPLAFVRVLFANYVINRAKAGELARHGVGTWKLLRLLWVVLRSQFALKRYKEQKVFTEN